MTSLLQREIDRRRTFAIISHPDAGKTTITEKLLLYGGAIQMAGTVKAKRSKKFATSDWMEMEKKRGISVTSSVMKFHYNNCEINLIDTPGHEDFSEDTYRTLTAVDSALMLIDAAGGVEAQTKKLFEVCALQGTPVMAFINKMDREGKDAFALMEEIEQTLGIQCVPVTWPIGSGDRFVGVYHRHRREIHLYQSGGDKGRASANPGAQYHTWSAPDLANLDPELAAIIHPQLLQTLIDEVELLDGAGESFSIDAYLDAKQAPVFFGSALKDFGVAQVLDAICDTAPGPRSRDGSLRRVDPHEDRFSAFVFKIQANMDPAHRDRVAFMRICSGRFERGMKAHIVRLKKDQRLGRPTQFMAQDRSLVDEAYAGDIVGVHDPGLFKIGDTLSQGEALRFTGIPVFAPENFVRVVLKDPLKSKQLGKALDQLSEEGAVQVFRPIHRNDQYLGVVGILQFDVVAYRIEHEYGVKTSFAGLPYRAARWIHSQDAKQLDQFIKDQSQHICRDQHDQYCILLEDDWRLKFLYERYPKVEYSQTSESIK